MKTLDWTKPIQTRDGRRAELLCDYLTMTTYTHLVKVTDQRGLKHAYTANANGRLFKDSECEHDIINVPPQMVKKTGWVVIYTIDGIACCSGIFKSKDEAEIFSNCWGIAKRIAIVQITWEEPA